jgi:hypothetical protein
VGYFRSEKIFNRGGAVVERRKEIKQGGWKIEER